MMGSTSQQPDLDWSQIRETIRMMNLAVAQIEVSMKDGDESVDALTDAFTTMAARVQVIEKLVKAKDDAQDDDSATIVEQCEVVHHEMQHAIVAFQFYDKLTQRLSHVSHTLDALSELVGDHTRLFNPMEWTLLQEKIKSKYTMPAEHNMFELIMKGEMSIDEILKLSSSEPAPDDDIELF
ncbi:MAG: hypothetical protein OEW63_06115 [Gammaproteobacteria bacterium]|nr:hypothetical protein [Gammaproteobacteria bacterium]